MSPEDRRLAALLAALLPARAAAVLARGPGAAAQEAARLAGLPRQDRLAALERALEREGAADPAATAALERPRMAAALAELARGGGAELPPVLVRLLRERLG
ncbi:MAG: hypothetical protein QM767_10300 [Anaeromyxobacter sp.]